MAGLPMGKQHFVTSLPFMVSALALALAVFAGFDYVLLEHIRFQDIRGTALLGSFFAIAAFMVVVAAHLEKDYPQLPVLITALLSCLPFVAILVSLFPYDFATNNDLRWPLVLLLTYCVFIVVRCINVAFYRPRLTTHLVTLAVLVLVATHSWKRYYFPAVFDSYNPSEYDDGPSVDIEHTLYQQYGLLDQQLQHVRPSEPGTDHFFLGFGGSDRQTVFETETLFAHELINTLYQTSERSLVLFNNVDKLDQQAIANTYNLKYAIEGIGRKMDPAEDVLIMLLTSHGDEDATLAVELEYLNLKTLDAKELGTALDEASIKWRVLIISACYSGSFIDELENENTLIITAASAQQSSFGCSSERELTVFGEAFFKHGLSESTNWVTAFIEAEKKIRAWESSQELPYSNPQIRVGHNIRLKLGLPVPPVPSVGTSALE